MLSSLAGFDWWILVIVPASVAIATYYFQKILDWTAVSSFRRLNRRRLRINVRQANAAGERLVEGTYQIYYMYLIVCFLVGFFASVITVMAIDFSIAIPSCGNANDRGTFSLLVLELLATLASMYVGLTLSKLRAYFKFANDPVSSAAVLHERVQKALPGEMAPEIETIMRMALRVQSVRDARLQQAKAEWSEAEVEQHQQAMQRLGGPKK